MKKLFILLLLTGCINTERIYTIEPDLNSYLDNFYSISNSYGFEFKRSNLILKLTHDLSKKGCLGLTTIVSDGQRTIEFDYDFWVASNESKRQVLSLHEFGHAFLRRSHNNDYSIMNPEMGDKGWPICAGNIECDHKFLLDELFRNK